MADNTKVLGISGQMDISDIQATIDKLIDSLGRVGVQTDEMSERMTKALNDIAQSDGDLATKTQQAMSILKQAMDEAQKGMSDVPAMIDIAQQHVTEYQSSIAKLNQELSSVPKTSDAYSEITKQIENQKAALQIAREDVSDLTQSYANASEAMGRVSGAYEALGAMSMASSAAGQAQSVTNVEVGATASAAAVATGAEAAAHLTNASAANANTQAENANVEATRNLSAAIQEYISVASGRAEIERMQSENSKDLRSDIKMYEESIREIQATLGSTDFTKKISDATDAIVKQQQKIETYKQALSNLTPDENATGEGTNYYNSLIDKAQQKIADLQSQIENWKDNQQRLNADLEEYNTLLSAAKQIQGGETIISTESQAQSVSIDVKRTSLDDLRSQLSDSKSKLQDLQAEADKFNGKSLGDAQKQKLAELNAKIDQAKDKIQGLQDAIREKNEETFIGRFRNQLSELRDKVGEFGSDIKSKLKAPFTALNDKIGNSSFGQRFSAEFSQVKAGMEDFKNGAINVITANGKLQENVHSLTTAIGGLGLPLGGALTGIKAVTKALWGMCATPIGAVIAVIVLGLKAVHTWMTKSAEGQKVYTKLMAYFGSLAASVTDIIVILGEWLYKCFTNANGPLKAFGQNFVYTFKTAVKAAINLIGGLGTTIKGIFNLDWDTFASGLKKTWDGLKGVGNTVIGAFKTSLTGAVGVAKAAYDLFTNDKLQGKLSSAVNSMFEKASKAATIASKQQEAEIAISKAKETQAKLDIQIAENREKIYKLTGKAKDQLIEETKALSRQKYDTIIKAQQKLVELQGQRNKHHTVSLQDIAKERSLRISLLQTEAQQAASTRMLTRMQEANRRSMARQAESAEKSAAAAAKKQFNQNEQTKQAQGKYDVTVYNNDNEREKAYKELETKLADARVAAMREGFNKTQAERQRQQQKELEQIQAQEDAAVEAELKRVKAEFDAQNAIRKARGQATLKWDSKQQSDDLEKSTEVKSIRKMYDELRTLTVGKQVEDERKAEDELISAHQSYTDKKNAIDKKYRDDLASINAAISEAQKRNDNERVEALRRSRNQLTTDYGKQMMQAAFDELKNSPDYVAAFTDIEKASTETLNKLLSRFEEVKSAAAFTLNPQDAKTYFDTVNGLIDELMSRDPVGMAKKLTEQLQQQRKELEQAQLILQAVQNGVNVPIPNQWKVEKNDDGTLKLVPTYYTLEQAQENVAKSGQAVAHTEVEIEKASKKVLSQILSLISAFTSLGNAIGGTAGNIINLIGDFANFTISTVNAVKSIDQNAKGLTKTLQQLQAGLTIASAFVGLASKVSSFFKTSDDYYQKYAKKQSAINSLRDSVNEYRLSVIKAQQAEKNWFATTGLQNLKDSWEQHTQVIKEYRDKLLEPQEIYKNKGAGLSKLAMPALAAGAVVAGVFTAGIGSAAIGALAGTLGGSLAATAAVAGASAAVGWIAGSGLQSGMDSITYKKGQTAAINNLRIQTRHRTAFRSEKTADLRDWVKQNYGEDLFRQDQETGMFLINADLAQKVIDEKGGKLKGQTKETLEKLIELRKEYDKFEDDLKDYVSQTYSPIVDDMSDAVWSWLSEGKDALQQFKDSASKTFSDIGKEMIKQMLLKDVFGTFQDDIYKLYKQYATGGISIDQLIEQMGEIVGATVGKFENNLPSLEAFVEKFQDVMSKYGFDVTGNQEQSASAKGVSSITYDQANLLVNLATARNIALEQGNAVRSLIQFDTTQLRLSTMQIQSDISVMRDIQEQGLTQITKIELNTRPISEILSVVQDIYKITKDNA
jgi:hypothetical protein